VDILEYEDANGSSPFGRWFAKLDAKAAAKVTVVLTRLGQGNTSNVRGVGAGVFEIKIDFGPGYRLYFGKDNDTLVILLGGGTKKRQANDIASAQSCWQAYKRRKRRGI
jgi:putative addiction module killer protein